MMPGDKLISCQTMDWVGLAHSSEEEEEESTKLCKSIKRKYRSNLTLLKTFLQGSACYSEEIFHFPGILKSTQNKGKYVNFQFGEKSN